MNPNARKRLNAMTRYDRDAHLRAERAFVKDAARSHKTRLFTANKAPKESDNMKRINHAEFTTYASRTTRIRVPNLRFYSPRICMPDGHTITITRKRAARYIRDMRRADNTTPSKPLKSVGHLQRIARPSASQRRIAQRLIFDARLKAASENAATNGVPSDNPVIDIPTGRMTASPAGGPVTSDQASRLWESWMRIPAGKLTFQQYMDRWVADNTG